MSPGSSSFKGAATVGNKHLFIYHVDKPTDGDSIKNFLVARQFTIKDFVQTSHDNAFCKSFELTVPSTEYGKLFDANLWPAGVRVRKFTPPRIIMPENSENS